MYLKSLDKYPTKQKSKQEGVHVIDICCKQTRKLLWVVFTVKLKPRAAFGRRESMSRLCG